MWTSITIHIRLVLRSSEVPSLLDDSITASFNRDDTWIHTHTLHEVVFANCC